ncbi:DUF1697 domain-containing protein [Paenibacillus sp. MBLB4367]|uniref:DUF1697 domain-containing protein n=1 Tax=Paenibacillus sp. MBLB4367 TaxID=3384767 RepID=UPI00390840D1
MTTYIALLRGINVSGQKLIKMAHLKTVIESLSFERVRTYIQSGNLLFESGERDTDALSGLIQKKIKEVYGFDVPVAVRTAGELDAVISGCPFETEDLKEKGKLYVSFLSTEPSAAATLKLLAFQSEVDDYRVQGRELYLLCRESYGKSLFSNNFVEKKLGVTATTRNWETVNKLAGLAKE